MDPSDTTSDPARPRRVSVRRRAAQATSASSSAADTAIRDAIERGHRRRLGLAAQAAGNAPPVSRGAAGVGPPGPRTAGVAPRVWQAVRVLVFAGAVVAVWQGVAGLMAGRRVAVATRGGCEFTGSIVLDGKPLAQAVIEFHPLDGAPGTVPLTVETDDKGTFARSAAHGLAAGRYAVAVRSGCLMPRPDAEVGTPVAIPSRYTRPESTPLQVAVSPAARLDLRVSR